MRVLLIILYFDEWHLINTRSCYGKWIIFCTKKCLFVWRAEWQRKFCHCWFSSPAVGCTVWAGWGWSLELTACRSQALEPSCAACQAHWQSTWSEAKQLELKVVFHVGCPKQLSLKSTPNLLSFHLIFFSYFWDILVHACYFTTL